MVGAFVNRRLLSPNHESGGGHNFSNSRSFPSRLTNGDKILVNGTPYSVVLISGKETAFDPPASLSQEDATAYALTLKHLDAAAQLISKISHRLSDSTDGMFMDGVGLMASNLSSFDQGFAQKVQGYLFAILKNGTNVDARRGDVFVPPCTREEFEQGLKNAQLGFNWGAWLDHAYNPIPKVTEGFYLFDSTASWANFEASLGGAYAALSQEVRNMFAKATSSGLEQHEWKQYAQASRQLMEMQEKRIEQALKGNEYAEAMSTRVYLNVSEAGEISVSVRHYTEEFTAELMALGDRLLFARNSVPAWVAELHDVLEAQADWCFAISKDPKWGQSLPAWIRAKDPSNLLDVNVTAEEKVSRIGAKASFHIQVTQHIETPPVLSGPWAAVQAKAEAGNVNMVLLRTLLVGGHTTHYTVSGEKLPDPAGEPLYKSMTFINTTRAVQVRAHARAIAASLGISDEKVQSIAELPLLHVTLHEFGHTLGDHAHFLGVHGGSTEETNAQASAIYLTKRFAPESLHDMVLLEGCWVPLRRMREGPTEQHSRSDIVMFEEYLQAGAIEISEGPGGKAVVRLVDAELAVEVAYKTALKMRLWEKGIPTRLHAHMTGNDLDPLDSGQEQRIIAKALQWIADTPQQSYVEHLKGEVLAESKAFFANERLLAIAAKAEGVLEHLPSEQPMTMVPTDQHIAALVA